MCKVPNNTYIFAYAKDNLILLDLLALYSFAYNSSHKNYFRVLVNVPNYEELVNAVSGDYCTALHLAVVGQFVEIVKLLLEKGAKKVINEGDWDSQTPLHSAVLTGNL